MKGIPQEPRAAWKLRSFARAIDKSRSWIYNLPPQLQPKSVKLGRNRLITEQPEAYIERLAEQYPKAA